MSTLLHEWDSLSDPQSCDICHSSYLDSGHHDQSAQECPVRLRDELNHTAKALDRALMEVACERGETHRRLPDGSQGDMWPWAARGWLWDGETHWYRYHNRKPLSVRPHGWDHHSGAGEAYGLLANIEAAEAWLAARI